MIVDCMTCPVRGQRCDDCSVTVLRAGGSFEGTSSRGPQPFSESPPFGGPQAFNELQLDAAEKRAVSLFVGLGLVSAGAGARLRARHEAMPRWASESDVG